MALSQSFQPQCWGALSPQQGSRLHSVIPRPFINKHHLTRKGRSKNENEDTHHNRTLNSSQFLSGRLQLWWRRRLAWYIRGIRGDTTNATVHASGQVHQRHCSLARLWLLITMEQRGRTATSSIQLGAGASQRALLLFPIIIEVHAFIQHTASRTGVAHVQAIMDFNHLSARSS